MMRVKNLVMLLVGVVLLAGAAAPAASADDVTLQAWTIRATTKNKDISPELKSIAEKLKRQFKYTGFKLEKQGSGKAAVEKTWTASLISGYEARITPKRKDDKQVQLEVEFLKREGDKKVRKLKATVTLSAGAFQLFGGWKLGSTDALIVAISGR